MKTKYMMATKAMHMLGDISRDIPNICIISDEDVDNYIGNWVSGYGFAGVKFPKRTTRNLTKTEIKRYHGMPLSLGDTIMFLDIKGENFQKPIRLLKGDGIEVIEGILMSPIKVGGILYIINHSKGINYRTSTIKNVNGNVVKTKNSTYTLVYL